MGQEVAPPPPAVPVHVPEFMREIIAEYTHAVRTSTHINQRSGVSVRFSIANLETMVASAVRRALRCGSGSAVPRMSDLGALAQSSTGRIEFEVFEEGREHEILRRLLAAAVLDVFRTYLAGFDFGFLLEPFEQGLLLETGDLVPADGLLAQIGHPPEMTQLLARLGISEESPEHAAAALEFALEGLHLTRRLNKTAGEGAAMYGLG